MMKRLLAMLTLSACTQATTPEYPSSKASNTPEEPPIPASLAAEVAPPSITPSFGFGAFAKQLSDAKTVKIRSRIQLKDHPGESEILLSACLPKAACPEILLRYEVENAGSTPVTLWHAGFWLNHQVVLLNEDGTEATLTKYGEDLKRAFTPRGARDKNIEWPVPAGKLEESEGPVSLFALSPIFSYPPMPGKYTVRVDYEEDIAFSSNTLTLWILPPGTQGILHKLNEWDKDECDVIERPAAHPNRVAAGESNGFVGTQKEALQKLGVTVTWDAARQTYRVASARLP